MAIWRRLWANCSIWSATTHRGDAAFDDSCLFAAADVELLQDRALLAPNAGVSGAVFVDANSSGTRDAGDSAMVGWRVYVDLNRNGIYEGATEPLRLTDFNGNYAFTGIEPGTYDVRSLIQPGWTGTAPAAGFVTITLADAQLLTGVSLGYARTTTPRVQILDDRDPGVFAPAFQNLLEGKNYRNGRQDAFRTFDKVAQYVFTGLEPGRYRVAATYNWGSSQFGPYATNVPYSVFDGPAGANLGTTRVDQSAFPNDFADDGVTWKNIGAFVISGTSLMVQVNDDINADYFNIDAVRIERLSEEIRTIDDGDVGYSQTGTWSLSNGPGFNGDLRAAAANSGAQARWTFQRLPAGKYRVATTWSPYHLFSTAAPFTVRDGIGGPALSTVAANQQLLPLDFAEGNQQWRDLGVFTITGESLVVELNAAAAGLVIADAVRIHRVDDAVTIIDDGDAGYGDFGAKWFATTGQGASGDTRLWEGVTAPNTEETASWKFERLKPGRYRVAANWTAAMNRNTAATFDVTDGAGGAVLASRVFNQQNPPLTFFANSLAWSEIGFVNITQDNAVVRLRATTGSNSARLAADAVRLERVLPAVQIIDDGDAGFGRTGTWTTTPFGRNNDSLLASAGTGQSVATYTFTGLAAGEYRVAASWVQGSNRATNTPFSVYDGVGGRSLTTMTLNQELVANDFTDSGTAWRSLGNFYISGDSLVVRISNNANEFVNADAIRIERLASQVQIIDDGETGFGLSGVWNTSFNPGFRNDLRYAAANSSGVATWTFNGLSPGQYQVSTTWSPFTLFATNAIYSVRDNFANTVVGTRSLNQRLAPNDFINSGLGWKQIATVAITGTSLSVSLPATGTNGLVIADAVRVERVETQPIYVDDRDSGFVLNGNWTPTDGNYRNRMWTATGPGSSAVWTISGLAPGTYRISTTWNPGLSATVKSNASAFTIRNGLNGSVLAAPVVDQSIFPHDFGDGGLPWEDLATVTITGDTIQVRLDSNATGEVLADAIRVVRM